MEKRFLLAILLPIAIIISLLSSAQTPIIEKYYAQGIYKYLGQIFSWATGLVPFSLAELIILLGSLLVLLGLFKGIRSPVKIKKFFYNLLLVISVSYFLFLFLWGLNYHRQPFGELMGIEIKPVAVEDLEGLCKTLIARSNELRLFLKEDSNGVVKVPGSYQSIFQKAKEGYDKGALIYPFLGGQFGQPKGIYFSHLLSYTGIAGFYFPFTFEANVNLLTPPPLLASTICHEMAHQRGFAREDEANFIAYLTCTFHSDPYFQYSGNLLALIHSMKALNKFDPVKYQQLTAEYSVGVGRDLQYLKDFWQQYEGPLEKISSRINDTYLKVNYQEEGIYSYGRMVDLLLAFWKNSDNYH